MEYIEMEHETSLIFSLLIFPNYLYSIVHLIFPVHCLLLSFYLFSSFATSFYFSVPFLWDPSHFFPTSLFSSLPELSQFPFVLGANHPHHNHLVFPALFWAHHLHGKPHSSDAIGKKIWWGRESFKNVNSTPEKKRTSIAIYRDTYTLYFVNCKSQTTS